jgi:hypothetical protein
MSSDHAGGPTSPVVSDALAAARDGTIGYWNYAETPNEPSPVAVLKDFDDLGYLMPETRALLFDTALLRGVTVKEELNSTKEGIGGTLLIDGNPILTIERPKLEDFQEQLKHIRTYADLRTDRLVEIQVQIDDILSFFGAIHYLDPEFRNYTQELLEAVVRFCISVEMQIKHYCRSARPVHYSRKVQPLIQTPDHSTFPSGHATEAFAVAATLYRLAENTPIAPGLKPGSTDPVFRMAERIAANRVVAGVHFPIDSAAGALLGLTIADHVASLGAGVGTTAVAARTFKVDPAAANPTEMTKDQDFDLTWLAKAQPTETPGVKTASTEFQELWRKANEEWR